MGRRNWVGRPCSRGMTLIEVVVAGFLLIIVFDYLSQFYYRGRRHIDYEEDRRKATAVAQMRMDALRRDYRYDQLPGWDDTDTTYVVDGDSYVVHHTITAGAPETNATTVALGVEWIAKVSGSDVARTLQTTTILARGLP